MLSKAQIDEYHEIGAIVVPDVLTPDEVQRLRQVTDEFVERARSGDGTVTRDLRPRGQPHAGKSAGCGASRQHTCTTRNTAAWCAILKILAVLQDLWGRTSASMLAQRLEVGRVRCAGGDGTGTERSIRPHQ